MSTYIILNVYSHPMVMQRDQEEARLQTCHYVYVPIIISRIQMNYWMITDTSSNISVNFLEKYKNVFFLTRVNGNKMFKIY